MAQSGLQAWMPHILERLANTPMSFGDTDKKNWILVQIACSDERRIV